MPKRNRQGFFSSWNSPITTALAQSEATPDPDGATAAADQIASAFKTGGQVIQNPTNPNLRNDILEEKVSPTLSDYGGDSPKVSPKNQIDAHQVNLSRAYRNALPETPIIRIGAGLVDPSGPVMDVENNPFPVMVKPTVTPGGMGYMDPAGSQGSVPDRYGINDMLKRIRKARDEDSVLDLHKAKKQDFLAGDKGAAFTPYGFDLSTGAVLGRIETSGYGIMFKRENSPPGARIDIPELGIKDMYPGERYMGPIDGGLTIARSTRSSQVGVAILIVFCRSDVDRQEPNVILPGETFLPQDLLGTGASATYSGLVAKDVAPTGASPTGTFDATGWKRLRILIDTQTGGVNATGFTIVPWFRLDSGNTWHESGPDAISFADTSPTAQRFRATTLEIRTSGPMTRVFLEPTNMLAVARTGLAYIVQGIE